MDSRTIYIHRGISKLVLENFYNELKNNTLNMIYMDRQISKIWLQNFAHEWENNTVIDGLAKKKCSGMDFSISR